ncbi:FAD-dependent oxidoreductase [Microbacterium sp.]|uniref:flavin monoamine oxidase family protein n=1 Tax=Microbacterium sp. TaxID=51671 RepID=UPI002811458E|nr:FAD-dependent oxidoreductase [Microbacterium sp.]
MSLTRRSLLVGAGTGAVAVLLAACTGQTEPKPRPTTPRPKPSAPAGVPRPKGWTRSAWSTDPYSAGSVSYLPAGAAPEHREALAESLDGRVFFAGEATDTSRPGTVLGAVDSGRRAAMAVIATAEDGERIAVIGAGASGAIAARTMADAGHELTIFEARDRTGGRILSVSDDSWPTPPQLGAWLVADADVTALQERLIDLGDGSIVFDSASGRSQEGEAPSIDTAPVQQAIEQAKGYPADLPLSEALQQNGADPSDPALAAALAWIEATTGADASLASSWYPPAIVPDALTGRTGELSSFIDDRLDGLDVTLTSPVVRIAYDDRGVSLRLGTGEALSFDRVVVSVPLGVLQRQGIEFAPALPFAQRGAIAALGSGALETIWMRFDEPFWDAEATIWHVVGGDGLIRTWLNLEPATGEPVLVGLVGGAAAEQFAELSDTDAETAALASLAYFAPAASDDA